LELLQKPADIQCDILIAGSGFGGSLMAMGLDRLGFEVCLVEKGRHPRFAIGESSTPIADMILRDLSDRYDLPWLHDFSRYGSWQKAHPEIPCGLKRGFSYYRHHTGQIFETDDHHSGELLVAASSSDELSDTNWLRADFDAFLVDKVREQGITYVDRTAINGGSYDSGWTFTADREGQLFTIDASFLVDATGGPALLDSLMGVGSSSDGFLTDSRALYSHFEGVTRWTEALNETAIPTGEYPYDPDHSALHHLADDSWIWMLRFNDERTSMGIVIDRTRDDAGTAEKPPEEEWDSRLEALPSVRELMEGATMATEPGRIIRTSRLQRKLERGCGPGWAALPHTIGFVDPLHSTGIAHTLTGVEKLLDIFAGDRADFPRFHKRLSAYEQTVFTELELVDRLVAGCYRTLPHFELFNVWSMLYFTAAIRYEQRRLNNDRPGHFLCAGDREMRETVEKTFGELTGLLDAGKISPKQVKRFRETVQERIEPWNSAGLLDPAARNLYRHTAVEL